MQAVILAAGLGTRMRPLTNTIPKPLVKVAGVPLIDHIGKALPPEIDEVIIVTHYMADQIERHCGSTWFGRRVRYVHQEQPKGTAHALQIVRNYIHGKFLVLYADDIHGAKALREAVKYDRAVLVAHHDHPERFGVVLADESGKVIEIEEKPDHPKTNLVNAGPMVLDERVFPYIDTLKMSPKGEFFLTEAVTAMLQDHLMQAVEQDIWIPIGYPEDITRAEMRLQKERPY